MADVKDWRGGFESSLFAVGYLQSRLMNGGNSVKIILLYFTGIDIIESIVLKVGLGLKCLLNERIQGLPPILGYFYYLDLIDIVRRGFYLLIHCQVGLAFLLYFHHYSF